MSVDKDRWQTSVLILSSIVLYLVVNDICLNKKQRKAGYVINCCLKYAILQLNTAEYVY